MLVQELDRCRNSGNKLGEAVRVTVAGRTSISAHFVGKLWCLVCTGACMWKNQPKVLTNVYNESLCAEAAMMMSLVELKMLQAVKPKEAPLHCSVQWFNFLAGFTFRTGDYHGQSCLGTGAKLRDGLLKYKGKKDLIACEKHCSDGQVQPLNNKPLKARYCVID